MLTVFSQLKIAAANRARYIQTRNEIANLPADIALDIGVFPADAERIAFDAVYGKAA